MTLWTLLGCMMAFLLLLLLLLAASACLTRKAGPGQGHHPLALPVTGGTQFSTASWTAPIAPCISFLGLPGPEMAAFTRAIELDMLKWDIHVSWMGSPDGESEQTESAAFMERLEADGSTWGRRTEAARHATHRNNTLLTAQDFLSLVLNRTGPPMPLTRPGHPGQHIFFTQLCNPTAYLAVDLPLQLEAGALTVPEVTFLRTLITLCQGTLQAEELIVAVHPAPHDQEPTDYLDALRGAFGPACSPTGWAAIISIEDAVVTVRDLASYDIEAPGILAQAASRIAPLHKPILAIVDPGVDQASAIRVVRAAIRLTLEAKRRRCVK